MLLGGASCRPQVGYDIYSDTDLLALDSGVGEGTAVAVAPPPGFLENLQREEEAGATGGLGAAFGGSKGGVGGGGFFFILYL